MNLEARIDRPEIMDSETLPPLVMERTLAFLRTTNRFFGGSAVVLRRLKAWAPAWPNDRPVRILDVGCGGGEILTDIAIWARRTRRRVTLTGIDIVPEIVAIARRRTRDYPEIQIERRDVFADSGPDFRFDYVTASLFLHHVASENLIPVIQKFDQLSTRGVIFSDLFRSASSFAAVSAASLVFGNSVVRHDGPLSVRRAFTIPELESLAERAGVRYLEARREPWFRLSLAGEKHGRS